RLPDRVVATTAKQTCYVRAVLIVTAILRHAMRRRFPSHLLALALVIASWRAGLADPAQINRRVVLPNGASLLVQTIDLRAASIALAVATANPGEREIALNRARGLVLDDEAHGVHHVNPPADNPDLRIPPRTQLTGDLVFAGPLAPSARQLTL